MTKKNYTELSNQELIVNIIHLRGNARYLGRYIKNHQTELFQEILNRTNFLDNDASIQERIYCIEHSLTSRPKCNRIECSNLVKWNGYSYSVHCSPRCSTLDPFVRKKYNDTNIRLHGDANYNNMEKNRHTKKEKYGDENYNNRDQFIQTMNDRYGVDSPLQSSEIMNRFNNTMMNRHGVMWAMQSDELRNKSIETCNRNYGCDYVTQTDWFKEHSRLVCNEKWGVDNPSKADGVKEKIQETMRKHHGVNWAMQSPEIRNKAKEFFQLNYGVDNPMQVPEVKNKMLQSLVENHPNGYTKSEPEQELGEFIQSIYDGEVKFNCRTILKDYHELDIYIPSKHLAIEFNGDYWHMNPRLYNESYYNSQSHCIAKDKWEYDRLKKEECESLGIKLIVVWEYDWIHSRKEVEEMLKREFTIS